MPSTQPHERGVSRRTVLAVAAWTVPVISVGAAAPAMASTGEFIDFTGLGCKYPGNSGEYSKGYRYGLVTTNPSSDQLLVVVTQFSVAGVPAPDYVEILPKSGDCGEGLTCATYENPPRTQQDGSVSSLCVPAGNGVVEWDAVAAEYNNSQNDSATINYDVYKLGPAGCEFVQSGFASTAANSLPPCPDAAIQPATG